jgi:hypothetical protein
METFSCARRFYLGRKTQTIYIKFYLRCKQILGLTELKDLDILHLDLELVLESQL